MRRVAGSLARRAPALAVLAAGLLLGSTASLRAQDTGGEKVVVAIVDDSVVARLFGGAETTEMTSWMVRYGTGQQRKLLLLRRSTATSGVLLDGLKVVALLQKKVPPKTVKREVFGLSGRATAADDSSTRAFFARLAASPQAPVRDVGPASALTIRLSTGR